jgi:6-phosphogluconolactonase
MMKFVLAGVLALAGVARAADCSPADLAYVGSDGAQLRALRFDACAGQLAMIGPVADVAKPRWVVAHPQLPLVYVAVDGSGKDGSVNAYALDRKTGGLTLVNEVGAGGGGTTYLALDADSMTLLAANFSGGSASSMAINKDGSLGALVSTIKAAGSGPHRRQAGPHAHGVSIDPSGRFALVSDMGADRIFIDAFDRPSHALSPVDAFATPPGSGPRRAVFGADGRFVYVLNELSAEIMTLQWDEKRPRLTPVQSLPTSSAEFKGAKSVSEIAVSRDGRFVYVADRGESALVAYRVNPGSGELNLLQRLPSGGDGPWAFDLHPSGKWLLVANFRSNRLNLFGIDTDTGQISDTGHSLESPGPVSVSFVN